MPYEDMPTGTFLTVDKVSLLDMSKAAAIARISFASRNQDAYQVVVGDNLVACIHIHNGISPIAQEILDSKNSDEEGDRAANG